VVEGWSHHLPSMGRPWVESEFEARSASNYNQYVAVPMYFEGGDHP